MIPGLLTEREAGLTRDLTADEAREWYSSKYTRPVLARDLRPADGEPCTAHAECDGAPRPGERDGC